MTRPKMEENQTKIEMEKAQKIQELNKNERKMKKNGDEIHIEVSDTIIQSSTYQQQQ